MTGEDEVSRALEQPRHHAYIVFGHPDPERIDRDGRRGFHTLSAGRHLSVDDARLLQEYATHSVGEGIRRVIIVSQGLTPQAQNALLKVVEDMRPKVYFFIFLPHGSTVLETLLSRCYSVSCFDSGEPVSSDFSSFISLPIKDRLAKIDALWDLDHASRHLEAVRMSQNFERYVHRHITAVRASRNFERPAHSNAANILSTSVPSTSIPDTGASVSGEHVSRCRRASDNLRDALANGSLHKGTLQILAFV